MAGESAPPAWAGNKPLSGGSTAGLGGINLKGATVPAALAGDAGASAAKKATDEALKQTKEMEKYLKDLFKSLETGSTVGASKIDKLKDSVRGLVDAIKQQTSAFANFTGLFDIFERKNVSGTRLMNRLKAQVSAMKEWQSSLGALQKKGVSGQLLNELRGMGAGAVDQIKALGSMSSSQLKEYMGLYNQKYSIAGQESQKMMSGNAKIDKQINLYITGNTIKSEDDVEKVTNNIVKRLRLAGVKV